MDGHYVAIGHYHCPAWNEFSVADTRLSPATLDAYEARSRFIALCNHGYTHRLVSQCLNDTCRMSSYGLRMWNELATLFLFGIVFLVVLKTTTNWVWFGSGLLFLTVGLAYAIARYKKYRQKNEND